MKKEINDNCKNEKLNIALTFSGGGFRASSFSLGTLSYLDSLETEEGTLLKSVSVLSTVSGGTITGARYAVGTARQENMQEIYFSLYKFLSETDLINKGLKKLIEDESWPKDKVRSFINAFALNYNELLFEGAVFGDIPQDDNEYHLKHISFNATEFANAAQFRFQRSAKLPDSEDDKQERGIIGNYYVRVPYDVADEIRIGDIVASSSCFPGGFEPIGFPTDFIYPEAVKLKSLNCTNGFPVGLMDGGIVDNQGIEPVLLADSRIRKVNNIPKENRAIDLIIVSDVTSPYMEDYVASIEKPLKSWRRLTPGIILLINTILLLSSTIALIQGIRSNITWLAATGGLLTTLFLLVYIAGWFLKSLPKIAGVPEEVVKPLGKLLRMPLGVYETIVLNRLNSLSKLVNDVFLKHVRRLNYRSVYEDQTWRNRRIMNGIYELKSDEKWVEKIKNKKLPEWMAPTTKIQATAEIASSMGTTLWFTKKELEEKNMLNSLIACGQFNTCWNLLEYVLNLEKDMQNTTTQHQKFLNLKQSLQTDWHRFQEDPLWMVNELNELIVINES